MNSNLRYYKVKYIKEFGAASPELAALVAWHTRNVFLTIGAGMAALWILQVMR